MNAPFVLISIWKVREGKYSDYGGWFDGLAKHIASGNPRMIAYHTFGSEDGSRVMGVQVHPDVASMDTHLRLVAEYAEVALDEFLEEPIDLLVAGDGDEARTRIEEMSRTRSSASAFPQHVGGFTRGSAAP